MPISASQYWPASTAALNTVELGDEPARERNAGLREQEQREQAGEHRWRTREAAVVGEVVLVVAVAGNDRDDRERADHHHRVAARRTARRSCPCGRGLHPDQDVPACAIDEYASMRFTSVWTTAAMLPTSSESTASAQTIGRQSTL